MIRESVLRNSSIWGVVPSAGACSHRRTRLLDWTTYKLLELTVCPSSFLYSASLQKNVTGYTAAAKHGVSRQIPNIQYLRLYPSSM